MSTLNAFILGAIQGLTEFLPISSSGHLVLGQHYLGISLPGHFFEVLVHLGTLCSVIVIFQHDIFTLIKSIKNDSQSKIYILALIVGSVPAVFVGLLLKDSIDLMFDNIGSVSLSLIVTGIWLILSKRFSDKKQSLSVKNGLFIGIFQAIAIIPGISRSGATIGMAMLLGISPNKAAQFSFLLAIPAIAGAGLLTLLDMDSTSLIGFSTPSVIAAFISSFIVGLFALKWLLTLISKGKFHWFGIYCCILGILTWVV